MGQQRELKLKSLEDLLLQQLEGLYDAESRWLDHLPKIAEGAENEALRSALSDQAAETQQQINRLENAFALTGLNPKRLRCEAMKGLVRESQQLVDAAAEPPIRDAALIAVVQKIKHYEIAAYGAARNFAMRCEQAGIADLLQQSLDEEGDADRGLTAIAEQIVNANAARA